MANLRVLGTWVIGATALSGACALAANWLSGSNTPSNSSGIDKLMKRFRDEGWPYRPDQIESERAPDEQNAAFYLETACDDLSAIESEDGKTLNQLISNTDSPALYTLTERDISRYESVLRLAERASQCSYLDFRRDWSQPMEVPVPELNPERLIGYLLIDRALIEAKAGHAERSLHDLQTVSRLAGLESEDVVQISCDQAIDLAATVWSVSELCAAQLTSNPKALKWFVGQMKTLHLNADLMPALRGGAYMDYYSAQILPIVQASTMFDFQARQQFASENLSQPYVESRLRLWTFVGDRLNHRSPGETQFAALKHALDQCDAWPGDAGQAARDVDVVTKYEDEQRQEQEMTDLVAMVQQNQSAILKTRQTLQKLADRTPIPAPPSPKPNPLKTAAGLPPGMAGGPYPGVTLGPPNIAPGAISSQPAIRRRITSH